MRPHAASRGSPAESINRWREATPASGGEDVIAAGAPADDHRPSHHEKHAPARKPESVSERSYHETPAPYCQRNQKCLVAN